MARNISHVIGRRKEIPYKRKYIQVIPTSIVIFASEKLKSNTVGLVRMCFVSHSMLERLHRFSFFKRKELYLLLKEEVSKASEHFSAHSRPRRSVLNIKVKCLFNVYCWLLVIILSVLISSNDSCDFSV